MMKTARELAIEEMNMINGGITDILLSKEGKTRGKNPCATYRVYEWDSNTHERRRLNIMLPLKKAKEYVKENYGDKYPITIC